MTPSLSPSLQTPPPPPLPTLQPAPTTLITQHHSTWKTARLNTLPASCTGLETAPGTWTENLASASPEENVKLKLWMKNKRHCMRLRPSLNVGMRLQNRTRSWLLRRGWNLIGRERERDIDIDCFEKTCFFCVWLFDGTQGMKFVMKFDRIWNEWWESIFHCYFYFKKPWLL